MERRAARLAYARDAETLGLSEHMAVMSPEGV